MGLIECRNKEESGWGPNAVFRFPKEGGTGGIWKKVAALLPQEKLRFQSSGHVTGIDAENKILTTADGHKIKYNKVAMYKNCPICNGGS